MGNRMCCCVNSRVGVSHFDKQVFILMVGLDNAGKTCTAKSIVGQPLENVAPTVGFSKVDHKYKGYHVTIYDLGGSKSFRGIWPKYYHEVHGFIFVVDSADEERLSECSSVLRGMLDHPMVKGKPILLLCNKADAEQAQDEVEVVSSLNIENLVNSAQCPTRVEASVATKNQGLREGYKWLVKSVIASYSELGVRVATDIKMEKLAEEERRKAVRKRMEERRRLEEDNGLSNDDTDQCDPPGFIPVDQLRSKWEKQEKEEKEISIEVESQILNPGNLNGIVRRDSGQLDLEPVNVKKKRGLLSRVGHVKEKEQEGGEEVRQGAHTGYRNWGLAEEL